MEIDINEQIEESAVPGTEVATSQPEESVEETGNEDVIETVSSGDSDPIVSSDYSSRFDEIVLLLENQNEQIHSMQETESQTLWNKPIEEYTPTEGLLLIMMFIMLFVVIYELVGGIIICKK